LLLSQQSHQQMLRLNLCVLFGSGQFAGRTERLAGLDGEFVDPHKWINVTTHVRPSTVDGPLLLLRILAACPWRAQPALELLGNQLDAQGFTRRIGNVLGRVIFTQELRRDLNVSPFGSLRAPAM